MKNTRRQTGFTLIEMMVTVGLVSILLSVGVPSFREFIKDGALTAGNNELVTAFNLARSEAVKRGARVTVCKSANQTACTTSDGWEKGWLIFTDENNNGVYDSANETLIRVHGAMAASITAVGNGTVINYVSYVMSGKSQQVPSGLQSGTILVSDDRVGPYGKNLNISQTGRISTVAGVTVP
ncbi:MAG TPA: prepilin-type N-terminal cleavage/methylation domain-containing protein [Gammaproteobacteria bacterium]|nr:prepilin-type N-terminal cleavage/methylation domain-containing protein [Gammaproteobacteria bacterium]